jgi:hypothetical protein
MNLYRALEMLAIALGVLSANAAGMNLLGLKVWIVIRASPMCYLVSLRTTM